MDLLVNFFNIILYQPFFNILVLLYEYLPWHDFGIAVIVLTLLIRIALHPLGIKAIKSQKIMAGLQPKIKEIQEKHKENKEKQIKETMELYRREKVGVFSNILTLLIQMPILLALFWVFMAFKDGLTPEELKVLYPFVLSPEINTEFLGIINLVEPSIFLAFFAGIAQFIQGKMSSPPSFPTATGKNKNPGKAGDMPQLLQKQMLYFFPIFTIFILWKLPGAIALYWCVTTLFSIFQREFILRRVPINKTKI